MSELLKDIKAINARTSIALSGARTMELMKDLHNINDSPVPYRRSAIHPVEALKPRVKIQSTGDVYPPHLSPSRRAPTVHPAPTSPGSPALHHNRDVYRHSCTPLVNWGYRVPIHAASKVGLLIFPK